MSLLCLTFSLFAVACDKTPEDSKTTVGIITLSDDVLTVSFEKQTVSINVDADMEWGVYPQADWIKSQPSGGVKGTTTVKLTIEENKTGDVREGIVEFRTKGSSVELPVKQNYDVEAVTIADANFLAALVEKYDVDGDGILSTKEASDVRKIECQGEGIKSMAELATYFTEITYLDCSDNALTELDVTKLTKLEYLDCSGNDLTYIDIQRLQRLSTFDCTDNANLTKIYVWFNFSAPAGFSKPESAEYVEPAIAAPEGYELVWHDEFDTAGISYPSTDNWWYETGDGGWGNNELQDYVSGGKYKDVRIAEVSEGTLKIKAQKIDGKVRSVRMNTINSWTYGYFEELGMRKLVQPALIEIGGKRFCLGHGDGLGPVPAGYRFLRGVFHSRVAQFLFSLLHPWIAFGLGNGWSKNNRLSHDKEYVFRGEEEPLYKFAVDFAASNDVDYFVFGHYHVDVHMTLPSGAQFHVLKDWMHSSPYLCFDGIKGIFQE